MVNKKVLMIVGPTAIGKTKLSLSLAKWLSGEIISCDSMQIYRRLDIGTAKIRPSRMQGVKHHLINIRNVDQRYTVSDFVSDALPLIDQIRGRHHLPIVVGGSNLYLQSLLDDFSFGGHFSQGLSNRHKLERYADQHGRKSVWLWLRKVDRASAQKIPPQNERRVIRALEISLTTGHRFSKQKLVRRRGLDLLIIGLHTQRQLLYRRINHRVDQMIRSGLISEAKWLYQQGGAKLPAGMGIGYHELYPYFKGEISLSHAVELIKRDSRHYAKRQLSWFRHKMPIHWYDLIQHPRQLQAMKQQIKVWLDR